jgi:hypothetical protein
MRIYDPEGYVVLMQMAAVDLEPLLKEKQDKVNAQQLRSNEALRAMNAYLNKGGQENGPGHQELYQRYMEENHKLLELQKEKKELQDKYDIARSQSGAMYEGWTFQGIGSNRFSDSYIGQIVSQGRAYPNQIQGDCGVCSMVNLANQQGGNYTEKSGLAIGFDCYSYKDPDSVFSLKKKEKRIYSNGGTSLFSQKQILNRLGYKAEMHDHGLEFDRIVSSVEQGMSVNINLCADDLQSGSKIAPRISIGKFVPRFLNEPANHAVVVAGIVKNPQGQAMGIILNDTGGHAGSTSSIYISKDKYEDMRRYTNNFSSIVCTGKKETRCLNEVVSWLQQQPYLQWLWQ